MRKSRIRSPDAGLDVPVCRGSGRPGASRHNRRSRRSRSLARDGRFEDGIAGHWRSGEIESAEGVGFIAVDRADARGIPVATVAIGKAGATNAGLLAAQILGTSDAGIRERVQARRDRIRDEVLESSDNL